MAKEAKKTEVLDGLDRGLLVLLSITRGTEKLERIEKMLRDAAPPAGPKVTMVTVKASIARLASAGLIIAANRMPERVGQRQLEVEGVRISPAGVDATTKMQMALVMA